MCPNSVDEHNKVAWDLAADDALQWSIPVTKDDISRARMDLSLKVTPTNPIPGKWLNTIKPFSGKRALLLAGAGGQQGPLLAAAGFDVVILDISKNQLSIDEKLLKEFGLRGKCIQGSYLDMSDLDSKSFDCIINPVSNCFFEDIALYWSECARVLKPRGEMIYGFTNPVCFQFDFELANRGIFTLKYPQPFSDLESLTLEEKKRFCRKETPLEFGHSFESQIGLALKSGFMMTDFVEDGWGGDRDRPIDQYLPQFIAAKLVRKCD